METPQDPGTPSTPPPSSPPPPQQPQPLTREQVLAKVRPPAIALIVAAGIGVAYGLLAVVLNMLGMTIGAATARTDDPAGFVASLVGGGANIAVNIIGIAVGVFIIFAAMKMMQLQMWPIAVVASIVAMVPCVSPCCLLGLPFGIWAIIVLADGQVKAAFS